MTRRLACLFVGGYLTALGASSGPAHAVELRVLSGNGARAAVQELTAQFERASGHNVAVRFEVNASLQATQRAPFPSPLWERVPDAALAAEGG
jgi:ABC-type molybdate transport system substrate-binding protein